MGNWAATRSPLGTGVSQQIVSATTPIGYGLLPREGVGDTDDNNAVQLLLLEDRCGWQSHGYTCLETAYIVKVLGFCAWASHLCTNTGALKRRLQRV